MQHYFGVLERLFHELEALWMHAVIRVEEADRVGIEGAPSNISVLGGVLAFLGCDHLNGKSIVDQGWKGLR